MTDNRLPPLRLNSAMSVHSNTSNNTNEGSQISLNSRERRRQKLLNQKQLNQPGEDEENQSESPKSPHTDEVMTPRKKNRRGRSAPQGSSQTNLGYNDSGDESKKVTERPPIESARRPGHSRRKTSRQTNNFRIQAMPNNYILEGLEEDIIEMDEENESKIGRSKETHNGSERRGSDASVNGIQKSVPTDKFYLELEKKFAIQNKELYERKEQERLRHEFQWQMKQKQKEEQKYQISTPKTALGTHKFLRKIFLFLQGINVGFQFWQIILIFFNNSGQFVPKTTSTYVNNFSAKDISTMMVFFEKLTLPVHSLSYFFLTICIVDTIDRVDFTKMNLAYFLKCISFQNQFWSIVFYSVALIASLSLIFVDEPVYLLNHLRMGANVSNATSGLFTTTINSVSF